MSKLTFGLILLAALCVNPANAQVGTYSKPYALRSVGVPSGSDRAPIFISRVGSEYVEKNPVVVQPGKLLVTTDANDKRDYAMRRASIEIEVEACKRYMIMAVRKFATEREVKLVVARIEPIGECEAEYFKKPAAEEAAKPTAQ